MIVADQIVVHGIGDYILQSDWMAQNKTKTHIPAFCHALTYSLLFMLFRPSLAAWTVIFGTHFFIDRYRLARYIVWAKNWIGPSERKWIGEIAEWHTVPANWPWRECTATGYPPDSPVWLSVWLLIIADNILHVIINGLALRYL